MFARNISLSHLLAKVINEGLRLNLIEPPITIKVKRLKHLATQITHSQVIQLVQLIQQDHLINILHAFLHLRICHFLCHFGPNAHSILRYLLIDIALESTLVQTLRLVTVGLVEVSIEITQRVLVIFAAQYAHYFRQKLETLYLI
jgi:hypothetical protein